MNHVALSNRIFNRRWAEVIYVILVLAQVGASSDFQQQQAPPQPQHYEQQHRHEYSHPQNENMHTSREDQVSPSPEQFVPLMTPEHIALSLRLTCERNRRLMRGSTFGVRRQPETVVAQPESHHIKVPSVTSSVQTAEKEATTVFHATSRRTHNDGKSKRILSGVESWGPNLQTFITELVSNILQLTDDENSIVLSLSMIYLDRASSVETLRSNQAPSCPFVSFRTVHRLLLSSILTAAQVVGRKSIEDYHVQLEDLLGVSAEELRTMMAWMKYALGDSGHFVGLGEMQKFKQMWERVFFSTGYPNPSNDGSDNPNSGGNEQTDQQKTSSAVSGTGDTAPSGFFSSSDTPEAKMTSTTASASHSSGGAGAGPAETQQFSKPPAFVHSKQSAAFAA